MNLLWLLLNIPLSIPALWMFHTLPCREAICEDLACNNLPANWQSFHRKLLSDPLFRKIFYARTNPYAPLLTKLSKLFYRPFSTMELHTDSLGGGMRIFHGYSTIVFAKSIGRRFTVYQQVTIGYNGPGDPPVIGDNVTITCGAKVLGNITVGDHVTVGANAVVIRDVAPGCTVGGVPARVLRTHLFDQAGS